MSGKKIVDPSSIDVRTVYIYSSLQNLKIAFEFEHISTQ